MLMETLSQVKVRLPPIKGVFDGLSFLSPAQLLSQCARAPLEQVPFLHLQQDPNVGHQYRDMLYVNWAEQDACEGKLPIDVVVLDWVLETHFTTKWPEN